MNCRTFQHAKHTVRFGNLLVYVDSPCKVRRNCHSKIFLTGNVLQSSSIYDVFSNDWVAFSGDTKDFVFLCMEIQSPTMRPDLHIFNFVFRFLASLRDSMVEKHFVSSANRETFTDGEDTDEGRSLT